MLQPICKETMQQMMAAFTIASVSQETMCSNDSYGEDSFSSEKQQDACTNSGKLFRNETDRQDSVLHMHTDITQDKQTHERGVQAG
jgi:hypothetical protein